MCRANNFIIMNFLKILTVHAILTLTANIENFLRNVNNCKNTRKYPYLENFC